MRSRMIAFTITGKQTRDLDEDRLRNGAGQSLVCRPKPSRWN
jgi:hypothetical protein